MTLFATTAERKQLSTELGAKLAHIEMQIFEMLSEGEVGTTTEHLNCDRYDMEATLLCAVNAFAALLTAHRKERIRLALDHDELEADNDTLDKLNSRLGYGHLQREMV
jgi:hypothetical protein